MLGVNREFAEFAAAAITHEAAAREEEDECVQADERTEHDQRGEKLPETEEEERGRAGHQDEDQPQTLGKILAGKEFSTSAGGASVELTVVSQRMFPLEVDAPTRVVRRRHGGRRRLHINIHVEQMPSLYVP